MEVDVCGWAELLREMAASRLSRLEVDYPSASGFKVRWSCERETLIFEQSH